MSKKRWEDETLEPTLEKYPERKESLLDNRERLNVPNDVKNTVPEFPNEFLVSAEIFPAIQSVIVFKSFGYARLDLFKCSISKSNHPNLN